MIGLDQLNASQVSYGVSPGDKMKIIKLEEFILSPKAKGSKVRMIRTNNNASPKPREWSMDRKKDVYKDF